MFRRRLTQKPSESLYQDFKTSFPHVGPQSPAPTTEAPKSMSGSFDLIFDPSQFNDDGKGNALSPKALEDSLGDWKNPAHLDSGFHELTQTGGFWPPTPSASVLHGGSAGDLHAFPHTAGLQTPISASTSNLGGLPPHSSGLTMQDFLYRASPGLLQNHPPLDQAGQALPPHAFDSGLSGPFGAPTFPTGAGVPPINVNQSQLHPSVSTPWARQHDNNAILQPSQMLNLTSQFRFRAILKAPTAMLKHSDETPITYLNKSQTYTISIADTLLERGQPPAAQYRTSVRISFDDGEQRARPASCWQLWRDGRGQNESHKRGGKLQAVEYVHPDQSHASEYWSNTQLVHETFDGFSVLWTPSSANTAECNVQARFNFLSTDFSHSKGVKGVPVRLCAKTEILNGQSGGETTWKEREICYCHVKTFRDHGSERKLANDKLHVNKSIDKVKQQIEQAETGAKESGKRRRSDSVVAGRPAKLAKRRTWSIDSTRSVGIEERQDPDDEDDELQTKLRTLNNMFSSIRPVSHLYLRGDEQDDLDAYPVPLRVDSTLSVSANNLGPPQLKKESPHNTSRSSNTSCKSSMHSPGMSRASEQDQRPGLSKEPSSRPSTSADWQQLKPSDAQSEGKRGSPQQLASPTPSRLTKVRKVQSGSELGSPSYLDALDVDRAHQPAPEPAPKPVACFFIKPSVTGKKSEDDYYRAIYLMRRTVTDLVCAIAGKCAIHPGQIVSTIRVNVQGLQIKAEDEMIAEMPNQQDMIVELDVTEETPDSAEQFLQSPDETGRAVQAAPRYRLTLRY